MKKITILIVEDEPATARGLQTVIMKFMSGFEIIRCCTNGQEGLDAILSARPDLVFTDIRMPVMDGLTMIQKSRAAYPDLTFVILTGYEEFEYAKTALKLGVTEYLLKPLKIEELKNYLHRFLQIREQAERRQQLFTLQSLLIEKDLKELAVLEGYAITAACLFYGSLFQESYEAFNKGTDIVNHLDHGFIAELENRFHLWIYPVRGHHANEYIYFFVCPREHSCPVRDVVSAIDEQLKKQSELYHNLIISYTVTVPRLLNSAISSCYYYAALHTPFAASHILQSREEKDAPEMFPSGRIKALCQDTPAVPTKAVISSFCQQCTAFWEKTEVTQLQLLTDIRYIFHIMIQKNPQLSISVQEAAEILDSSDSFGSLRDNLDDAVSSVFRLSDNHLTETGKIASRLHDYIDANFTKSINFKSIFSLFPYSEKYLVFLFRNEYNITPSKYITQLRMDLARRLMQENPAIPLKDIAAMSGFEDFFYFSRVFKNTQGLSPSEYHRRFERNGGSEAEPGQPKS